jgi:hypothetical protein
MDVIEAEYKANPEKNETWRGGSATARGGSIAHAPPWVHPDPYPGLPCRATRGDCEVLDFIIIDFIIIIPKTKQLPGPN